MATLFSPGTLYPMLTTRADTPAAHRALKAGNNFTLHHIMPYRYAASVGFILDKLLKAATGAGDPGRIRATVRAAQDTLFVNEQLKSVGDLPEVHLAAWMGANLFMGPEGQWRVDDPKHDRETLRPPGFSKARWTILDKLYVLLDSKFDYIDSHTDAAVAGCKLRPKHTTDFNPATGAGDWLTAASGFLPLVRSLSRVCSDKAPYLFDKDDWLLLGSKDPDWKQLWLDWNNDDATLDEMKNATKNLMLTGQVRYLRCGGITRLFSSAEAAKMRGRQFAARDSKPLRDAEAKSTKDYNEGMKFHLLSKNSRNPKAMPTWKTPTAPEADPMEGVLEMFGEKAYADQRDISVDMRMLWCVRPENIAIGTLKSVTANLRVGAARLN